MLPAVASFSSPKITFRSPFGVFNSKLTLSLMMVDLGLFGFALLGVVAIFYSF